MSNSSVSAVSVVRGGYACTHVVMLVRLFCRSISKGAFHMNGALRVGHTAEEPQELMVGLAVATKRLSSTSGPRKDAVP